MIFNRWFWFSVLATLFTQSVQWRPALAEQGRMPAIEENLLSDSFLLWIADFDQKLDKSFPARF